MKPLTLRVASPILFVLAAFAAVLPAIAQTEKTFGEVSEVTVVEVPVQVVHDGQPVQGLTADRFRILDEGTPRALASFEVIDRAAAPAEAAGIAAAPTGDSAREVTSAGRRHFLLLFDLAFTPPHDLDKAERAARELLDDGLHPSDLVGVAFYSPRRGASLLVNFTTDRGEVRRVLDGLRALLDGEGRYAAEGAEETADPSRREPLGLRAAPFDAVLADVGDAGGIEMSLAEQAIVNRWAGPVGGSGGLEYNKIANMMWTAEQQIHDRRAGRVYDLARSLASLARQTAAIRGAKHLVFFSNGFDADLLQPKVQAGPENKGDDQAWWATGGGSWIMDEVNAMIEELRRSGWLLHAVELGGLDAHGRFSEGLFFVARGTGGALYENTNDVGKALGEVLEATSVTYLLTFAVDALPAEPEFRRLEVRVDGLPRGARVGHRAGYPTPRPNRALSSTERRAEAHELLFSGQDRDAIGSAVLAVPRRAAAGGWRVPIVLELEAAGLLAGPAGRAAGAEIYVYAFASDGGIVDFVAHRVAFTEEETARLSSGGGLKFLGDLDLPDAGPHEVRVMARSLRSGAAMVRSIPLDLPTAGGPRSVLLPPVVLQGAGDRWVVVTELPQARESGSHPFTFHGRELVPSAGTVAQGPGETRFLILGYGLGGSNLQIESRLTTPAGDPLDAAPASFLARAEGVDEEPELILATVATDALAPGLYSLEVVLRDGRGDAQGRVATPLRVRP